MNENNSQDQNGETNAGPYHLGKEQEEEEDEHDETCWVTPDESTHVLIIDNDKDSYYWIPKDYCAPYGWYPNPLQLKQEDYQFFSPLILYPTSNSRTTVHDHTNHNNQSNNNNNSKIPGLLPLEFVQHARAEQQQQQQQRRRPFRQQQRLLEAPDQSPTMHDNNDNDNDESSIPVGAADNNNNNSTHHDLALLFTEQGSPRHRGGNDPLQWSYGLGRYDENRLGLYRSDLFVTSTTVAEKDSGRRTVHVGIDLDGPVGTAVHAVAPGIVHSIGYNPAWGDYGHVIIVQQVLPTALVEQRKKDQAFHINNDNNADDNNNNNKSRASPLPTNTTFYALYGHLMNGDESREFGDLWQRHQQHQLQSGRANQDDGVVIEQGQVLGHLGAYWDNGGWATPHVHFQLSVDPPTVPHDLPGVVTPKDRPQGLWQYPDPRYILGPLY
ncbi:hypothetical protein ACA910_009325 [Epithemia clementina (nom. ined.)]